MWARQAPGAQVGVLLSTDPHPMWQQQRYYWVLCWRGSDVRGCAFTLSSLNILTDWAVRTQAITTARRAIQDLQAEHRRVIVHAERHVPPRPGRPLGADPGGRGLGPAAARGARGEGGVTMMTRTKARAPVAGPTKDPA